MYQCILSFFLFFSHHLVKMIVSFFLLYLACALALCISRLSLASSSFKKSNENLVFIFPDHLSLDIYICIYPTLQSSLGSSPFRRDNQGKSFGSPSRRLSLLLSLILIIRIFLSNLYLLRSWCCVIEISLSSLWYVGCFLLSLEVADFVQTSGKLYKVQREKIRFIHNYVCMCIANHCAKEQVCFFHLQYGANVYNKSFSFRINEDYLVVNEFEN